MRCFVVAILLLTVNFVFAAERNEESILFQKDKSKFDNLVTFSKKEKEKDAKCKKLSQKAESLKGRPQLRFTAIKMYEAECLR